MLRLITLRGLTPAATHCTSLCALPTQTTTGACVRVEEHHVHLPPGRCRRKSHQWRRCTALDHLGPRIWHHCPADIIADRYIQRALWVNRERLLWSQDRCLAARASVYKHRDELARVMGFAKGVLLLGCSLYAMYTLSNAHHPCTKCLFGIVRILWRTAVRRFGHLCVWCVYV